MIENFSFYSIEKYKYVFQVWIIRIRDQKKPDITIYYFKGLFPIHPEILDAWVITDLGEGFN